MLALSRNVPQAHESLKAGSWSRSAFIGVEIRNKVLGIVGLGRVGSEVARRAQSFGMRVLGYDPFINPEAARLLGIELTSLDNLFEESDFITLHTPLTPGTQNLINDESLAKMKPGARLINVARGELVDSEAVRKALDEGRLAGAAVDVFPTEPPGDDEPLINHPKVIATPHLGASTREAQREVAIEVAEQVIAVLSGVFRPATQSTRPSCLRKSTRSWRPSSQWPTFWAVCSRPSRKASSSGSPSDTRGKSPTMTPLC